jgi:hypothetical protein
MTTLNLFPESGAEPAHLLGTPGHVLVQTASNAFDLFHNGTQIAHFDLGPYHLFRPGQDAGFHDPATGRSWAPVRAPQ